MRRYEAQKYTHGHVVNVVSDNNMVILLMTRMIENILLWTFSYMISYLKHIKVLYQLFVLDPK